MADMKKALGVVGERDVVSAFRAVGMRVMAADTPDAVSRAVFTLAKGGAPVIFITEKAARSVPDVIARYKSDPDVALIPIPGSRGTDGYGMEQVRANVEKAIGTNILLGDEN